MTYNVSSGMLNPTIPYQVTSDCEEICLLSCAQVEYDSVAGDCRLGTPPLCRPFSGVTAVLDYCTHSHKDVNNMPGGCTAVRRR